MVLSLTVSRSSSISSAISCRMLSMLGLCTNGPGVDGLRILLRLLTERKLAELDISCPALGAAVTTVPGVAAGAGLGESLRNRGWMCASFEGSIGDTVREFRAEIIGDRPPPFALSLRLGFLRRGSRSSGHPGELLRLVVGDAGIVSKNRGESATVLVSGIE